MLSRRILYFVDDRIFFHCRRATFSECSGVTLRLRPTGNDLLRMLVPLRDYKSLIKVYNQRVLTKPFDAFGALAGMIGRFAENQKWWFFEGIPNVAVENMMLFRRRLRPLSRRPKFPSFSWLGWEGELEFMEGSNLFEAWIDWYIRYPSAGVITDVGRPSVLPQAQAEVIGIWATDAVATYTKPDFGVPPREGIQWDKGVNERLAKLHPSPIRNVLLCFSTLAVFFELTHMDYVKALANVSHPVRGTIGKQGWEKLL